MPRPSLAPARIAPASADSTEVLALLRRIAADLHTLAAAAHPAGSRNEDAALGGLLRAIHACIADRVFSAGDLLVHAALPVAADLHAAIVATVRAANARKVGKALARAEGRHLGGFVVVRMDMDSTGILWCVRRVSQTQSP